ncbi:hypothetical protein SAY87_019518 [Trapa incisa]|uniref:DC1 domain-containing protein n=1 Tax=Trapa incisa TaxID=236973 RepID=A0AAN7K2I6_9MYRT|nr:hypothetical protein SAY87_019518 [Trapa incisa]
MNYSETEISHFSHPNHKLILNNSDLLFKCDGCKEFLSSPPGDALPYCNACEKDVGGFVYHCAANGYDLHPCCAKLPMVLNDGEVKLYLYSKVSSSCNRCGRKGRSWAYRSTCKKYNLHVACVREMVVDSCSHLHGGSNDTASASASQTALEIRIPRLKDTVQASSSMGKDKVKKGCEKAGMALKVVVSAVFGDPTALIAGAIYWLVS